MRLDDGPSGILVLAFVDNIHIFAQCRADRGHVLLLLARSVEAAFGIQGVDLLVAFKNLNDGKIAAVVRILLLGVRAAQQGVGTECQFVAESHFLFSFAVEGRAQNSQEDQRHAEVDDVTSIAASIAMPQANHRYCQVLAGMAGDHASAAHEL
jgi:hypothetical protein